MLAMSLYSFSVQYLHNVYNKKVFFHEQGFNTNKKKWLSPVVSLCGMSFQIMHPCTHFINKINYKHCNDNSCSN